MKLKLASLTLLSVALIATACSNNDNSTTQSSRTIENSKKSTVTEKRSSVASNQVQSSVNKIKLSQQEKNP